MKPIINIQCKKYNIANRLVYNNWMYCEGYPKPYMRGKIHGIVAMIIPFAWLFIVKNHDFFGKFIFTFYMFCNLFSYGISYIYHVYSYKYGPDIENLIIKLDRSGIFLNVSGNFTPVSILFMKKTGIYLCCSQWLLSFIGIYRIFFLNRTIWWEPLGVGAIAILFIPEMWEVMTIYEFWMTMSSYVFSVIGGIFTYYKIDLYVRPHIWGYHENFHFCVTVAAIIVYFINYSLSCRYSLPHFFQSIPAELIL